MTLYLHFSVTEEVLKRCHISILTRPHTLPRNKSVPARGDFDPEFNYNGEFCVRAVQLIFFLCFRSLG